MLMARGWLLPLGRGRWNKGLFASWWSAAAEGNRLQLLMFIWKQSARKRVAHSVREEGSLSLSGAGPQTGLSYSCSFLCL